MTQSPGAVRCADVKKTCLRNSVCGATGLELRIVDRAVDPRRLAASFGFAFEGLQYLARTQANWRIHVVAALGAGVAAGLFQVSPVEWAVLVLTIGLVLAVEAVNTAVERAVDAQGGPPSVMAKQAKDASAAAALVAAGTSLLVAAFIFGPRLAGVM